MTDTFLLTMQYEERLCLPVFLAHYSRFIPAERTFIIDHGSGSNIVPQAGQPDQVLYMPNGFSPLQDCFIDLTERFPALAAAGDVP